MNKYAEKSRECYNRKADNYDNTFDGRFTEKFKKLLADSIMIDPGDNVLDIACGNGTLLKMLSGKYDFKGYGIDISEKMIENAQRKCKNMKFEVSSCEHTPFEDKTFDAITVCASYHHFPDTVQFAKEANRILKPHGMLYIAEVYYPFFIRTIFNPFIPLLGAGDVKFYSPDEIQTNLEDHGFERNKLKIEGHIQLIEMRKK